MYFSVCIVSIPKKQETIRVNFMPHVGEMEEDERGRTWERRDGKDLGGASSLNTYKILCIFSLLDVFCLKKSEIQIQWVPII